MPLTPVEQQEFEDRADILESEARMSRDRAEEIALRAVMDKRKKANTNTSTQPKESRHARSGGEF